MTKEAVELRPENYGLTWENSAKEIDEARVSRQAEQVSDVFKEMIEDYTNRDSYIAKAKKNIEELVDWHNNSEYNLGKSANRRYLDDIFEIGKPLESRNNNPLRRIVGEPGEFIDYAEEMLNKTAKSRPMKAIFAIIGGLAVITGGYYWYLNHKNKKSEQKLDKAA